jgi:hypothetical protein
MQNVIPPAGLRALRVLGRHNVAVSWVGGKVEFRSHAKPPDDVIALMDAHESAIVNLLRPNSEGRSALSAAQERYRPLLEALEAQRPPDEAGYKWRTAMEGLEVFLLSGQGDEALRLGWPHDELYAVPPVWSRVDLCGCALLIGDREVISIEANRIQIKTASGAAQSFYRKPEPDLSLVHRERMKLLQRNLGADEARLRSLDFTIDFARQHFCCDLEEAKTRVRDAIARAARAIEK